MTAKRRVPVEVRNPGAEIRWTGAPIFNPADIPDLAEKAKLNPVDGVGSWKLPVALERAFFDAFNADYRARNSPPPAELREGFDGAARAARELLKALGVAGDAKAIVGMDRRSIAGDTGVMHALLYWGADHSAYLPDDVIRACSLADDAEDEEGRRRNAGRRVIVEAAQFAAYLSLAAEGAKDEISAAPPRSGPQKDFFSLLLLEGLAGCYREMFGEPPKFGHDWPKNGNLYPFGPPIEWLTQVLTLARDRLARLSVQAPEEGREARVEKFYCELDAHADSLGLSPEPTNEYDRTMVEMVELVKGMDYTHRDDLAYPDRSGKDELARAISALLEIPRRILASKFEKAARRVKRRDAKAARELRAPSPSG